MNGRRNLFLITIVLLIGIAAPAAWGRQSAPQSRQHAEGKENVLVGRISSVEGELLRYVPAQKDWVVTVKDAPFGLEDALYSGEGGKAEFLMPNSTWLRIGSNTQIQMIALKPDATEIDVAVGTARFIDKSSKAIIKTTTPFGYVVGEPGSAFDLYVGDESVEVIGIRGHVEFIHDTDGSRYEVIPGSLSILADARQATASEGKVEAEWDDWNSTRDTMWSQSMETKGDSVNYLPEGIREEAGTLDANGRWERVHYEGEYRNVWRPTQVAAGWQPYSVGSWVDWYGDYCWVPDEPFGYVTHHYGSWFWANNYWYWSPPIVRVGIGVPWWGIGFSWYPGRVGWLYSGVDVGWFPLLPWEPFYAHRWWGPRSFVVRDIGVININLGGYRYANQAFIVNQGALFTTRNLSTARIANMDPGAIRGSFRGAPVLGGAVLANANINHRFNFTNASPTARPGPAAMSRIAGNQAAIGAAGSVNGRAIQRQLATAPRGRPVSGASVGAPTATSRLTSGAGAPGTGPRALKQNLRAVQPGASHVTSGSAPGSKGTGAVRSGARSGRSGTAGTAAVRRGQTGVGRAHGANVGRVGPGTSHGSQVGTRQRASGIERRGAQSPSRVGSSGRSHIGGPATGSRGQFRGAPGAERRSLSGPSSGGHRAPQSGMHAPQGMRGGPAIQRAPNANPGGGHGAPKGGQGPGSGRGGGQFRG